MNVRGLLFLALLGLLLFVVSPTSSSSSFVAASLIGAEDSSSSVRAANDSSSTGADAVSSSADPVSSSAVSISSSYVVPVPSFNFSSYAAFFDEPTFEQPASFVVNMDNVTAFDTCVDESPSFTVADLNFTNIWAHACRKDGTLTLDLSIFDRTCGFDNATTYINVTAYNQKPTDYSPSLYPVSYVIVADGKALLNSTLYTVVNCPLSPSGESSSTGVDMSSTGAEPLSSSVPSISSSYVPPLPATNYTSYASFYVDPNFKNPAAFYVNFAPVTAFDACFDASPSIYAAQVNFTNVWVHACSYNGSLLTIDLSIFNHTCGFDNTTTYINVTATNQVATAFSPSLYPVSYVVVADGKTVQNSTWYSVVVCPTFPSPSDDSSSDSSVGVVIGGVVIGVIVVFIVVALLYSRRNRRTVDQTSGNTTDANQAYSRL